MTDEDIDAQTKDFDPSARELVDFLKQMLAGVWCHDRPGYVITASSAEVIARP